MWSSLSLNPPAQAQLPRHRLFLRRPPPQIKCAALTKQAQRFLTSVSVDPSVSDRRISKFVESSSKCIALSALSHLLSPNLSPSHLSSLALPLYTEISKATWFNWNPKIVTDLVALLNKQGESDKAQALIFDAISKLGSRERDLTQFYCNLIESHATCKSRVGFYDSYNLLKQVVSESSSVYVKRQGYKSMISGLCNMDSPIEAEKLMENLIDVKIKPSIYEYRCLIYAYGRLGLFNDMNRCVSLLENEGFELDTVSSNMVISSLGAHNEFFEMVLWLKNMKKSGIEFSIRTYNSVLNSCPTIRTLVQDIQTAPISIQELIENLTECEGHLVQELIESSVLKGLIEWDILEGKLDLHGMHLSTAYLVILQLKEELKCRFKDEKCVVPMEFAVICGLGKHSAKRGESPVKGLVKQMMIRMNCPMRIDRKNVGCFIGKGVALKEWLKDSDVQV